VAEEQAAQARRAEAEAEAKTDHAQHERGHAEELHSRATEIDPDAEVESESNGKRRFFKRGRLGESEEQQTDETQQVPAQGRRDSTH
jgi:hypothetical protein